MTCFQLTEQTVPQLPASRHLVTEPVHLNNVEHMGADRKINYSRTVLNQFRGSQESAVALWHIDFSFKRHERYQWVWRSSSRIGFFQWPSQHRGLGIGPNKSVPNSIKTAPNDTWNWLFLDQICFYDRLNQLAHNFNTFKMYVQKSFKGEKWGHLHKWLLYLHDWYWMEQQKVSNEVLNWYWYHYKDTGVISV